MRVVANKDGEGTELRCYCGKLLAEYKKDELYIFCRRCKRVERISADDLMKIMGNDAEGR